MPTKTEKQTKTSRKPTQGEQLAALLHRLADDDLHPSVLVALLHYGGSKTLKAEIRATLQQETIY